MKSKAVAINALSLVAIITIIAILSLVGLYKWFEGQTLITNQANCFIKFSNYCLEWAKTGYDTSKPPYDWDSKSPVGCDKVKINKPQSSQECIGVSSEK